MAKRNALLAAERMGLYETLTQSGMQPFTAFEVAYRCKGRITIPSGEDAITHQVNDVARYMREHLEIDVPQPITIIIGETERGTGAAFRDPRVPTLFLSERDLEKPPSDLYGLIGHELCHLAKRERDGEFLKQLERTSQPWRNFLQWESGFNEQLRANSVGKAGAPLAEVFGWSEDKIGRLISVPKNANIFKNRDFRKFSKLTELEADLAGELVAAEMTEGTTVHFQMDAGTKTIRATVMEGGSTIDELLTYSSMFGHRAQQKDADESAHPTSLSRAHFLSRARTQNREIEYLQRLDGTLRRMSRTGSSLKPKRHPEEVLERQKRTQMRGMG